MEASNFTTGPLTLLISCDKIGKTISADNLPDKSRNLSSYITECGSAEKFELLLEKCQLLERRHFSKTFVVISALNSWKISERREIFLQLLRQCTIKNLEEPPGMTEKTI
jgi:hypothetical protein